MKLDVISKAKGSAYIEMGNTKVISSVSDPREIPKQNNFRWVTSNRRGDRRPTRLLMWHPKHNQTNCSLLFSPHLTCSTNGEVYCEIKFSPYASKTRSAKTDVDEKSLALSLKRALQPAICRYAFPNFQVDIFVHVLEDDGAVLAAAINAAGAALTDAGIPMYDIITASALGVFDKQIVLDPTSAEENVCSSVDLDQEHGIVVMSNLQTHEQVSELWLCGLMTGETVTQATNLLQKSNRDILPIIKQLLVDKVQKNVEANDAKEQSWRVVGVTGF